MKHLRLSIYDLEEHAQTYMKRLGITYELAVPQSMGDQWWFFGCRNVPEPLPEHLTTLDEPLESYIGHGLDADDVAYLKRPQP